MAKELGDVLWYLAQIASELGLDLDQIAQTNLDKLLSRQQRGVLSGRATTADVRAEPHDDHGEARERSAKRAGTSARTLTPSGVSWRAISPASSCSSARLPPFA